MKQKIIMFIDMTEDKSPWLCVTLHTVKNPVISIHGHNFPVTIDLTPDQAFDLYVNLKSVLKKVQLALKERG